MSHSRNHGISRRRFLQAGIAGVAAAAALPLRRVVAAVPARRPPNLLFLHVDQMSLRVLAEDARPFVRTPNLERLANRGVSFGLSYSANPVCCPGRAAWYTGRPASENGVVQNDRWPLVETMPDLGQWFGARGYEPVYVGKWHVTGRDCHKSFRVLHGGTGVGEHCDAAIARTAQGFLANYRGDKPFFLSVGFLQPHDICYWAWFHRRAESSLPAPDLMGPLPPLLPNHRFDPREPETIRNGWREGAQWAFLRDWSAQQWRYYLWSYYRHVEMVDAEIGRVLDALDDAGRTEDTVVVFSSDHGDGMGGHRMVQKMYFYEEAAAVPFIVSWPGRIADRVRDTTYLVSGLDVAPTLCDFAGLAAPPKARGRSLRPLLEQRPVEWREFLVAETHTTGRMVRTPEFKYIAYQGDPTEQLFDLRTDPWETRNAIGEPARADTVADLRKRLAEWEASLAPVDLTGRQRLPSAMNEKGNPSSREPRH